MLVGFSFADGWLTAYQLKKILRESQIRLKLIMHVGNLTFWRNIWCQLYFGIIMIVAIFFSCIAFNFKDIYTFYAIFYLIIMGLMLISYFLFLRPLAFKVGKKQAQKKIDYYHKQFLASKHVGELYILRGHITKIGFPIFHEHFGVILYTKEGVANFPLEDVIGYKKLTHSEKIQIWEMIQAKQKDCNKVR